MQIIIGLVIVLAGVFGGFIMASGKLAAFWQPAELVVILGAGLGSMIVGNSKVVLKDCLRQLKGLFGGKEDEAEKTRQFLMLMHHLLDAIRQNGLLVLDEHVEEPFESPWFQQYPLVLADPILVNFIADNLRMLSMGKANAHEVEALLEQEIMAIEDDLLKPSKALHRTGEAMPGFGILAAVGGIIITMQYLDGPLATIGLHVAAALVGTFIGIFFCYGVLEPAASALHEKVHRHVSLLEAVKAILTAQLEGKAPLLAVDAGRRVLELDIKPSFATLENWIDDADGDEAGFEEPAREAA
ncbi:MULTISPECIES: flagellar motor stator protein MotA [Marinobacter]|uniref:Flagellar motor stator protein MotA n=1 Tax=Marinobacter xestospongiae TaxID=994319 RepID=A0ABU3VWJ7_9GAMM|nr:MULTISPECIES: flagellar motor stator protein MotA [Marinobacter]MCG8517647.1 flagellar motor stator protein MotA [Pseudomonadales bacterium]MCK7567370.1 flagellar motor stator protein MotA [Marinobacter xestospongiae]MDV2078655.1 flagellar motor stator protein MotA [Marinobacter xestospongiae]UDL05515.1 flagellar motor stator protein MotA [Marinobacter sp. CA1]